MAFKATKEWLEAAKLKPVSYGTVLFICGLMTEDFLSLQNTSILINLGQLFSVFPKVLLVNTQAKKVLSRNAWLTIGLRKTKFFLSKKESCLS